MKIKNKEKIVELLKHWRDLASKNPIGEHYDLTGGWWLENLKKIKEIVNGLSETENIEESRKLLNTLFKRGKDQLIWSQQALIVSSFIQDKRNQKAILELRKLVLDVASSEKFDELWVERFYSMLKGWNPKSVEKFKALKRILFNILGELFGKLRIGKYPVINSCSRRFLEEYFEVERYDYEGYLGAFEELKKLYLSEVGRLSKLEINIEIDMMFNYFDKKSMGNIVTVLQELKNNFKGEWGSVEKEFMESVEQIRSIIYNKIDQNQPFSEEDIEKILSISKNVPKNCRFLLSFIASAGRPEKEILLSLVNNEHFVDFANSLKDGDLEAIKANYDAIKNKEFNVKHTTLTTWLAILRPDLFMPLWGYVKDPGTLPQDLLKGFEELRKFVQWWNLSTNDLFELLDVLRNAANDAGINNMFEAAFYLNKYESKRKEKPNYGRRIWLIAPGTRAEYWNICVKRGIICVGWREAAENLKDALFNINNYKTFKTEMSRFGYKDSAQLWKFIKDVSIGDILLAKKGVQKIIGIGVVDSKPEIDLQLEYPIYRKVRWYEVNLNIDSPKQFAGTITELTGEDVERVPELKEIIDKMVGAKTEDAEKKSKDFERISNILKSKKQLILYGPPGTGKTWLARNYVEAKKNGNRELYEFVTFHPSYSYEEFVEGLKPVPAENGVKFVVEDGIFKRLAIKAMCEILKNQNDHPELSKISENLLKNLKEFEKGIIATKNNVLEEYSKLKKELWANLIFLDEKELKSLFRTSDSVHEYYLVIDEINRGDISKIFGELITLLEADKRLGGENQIFVTLPYSKEPFAVPPNLHIIGTMNTADRSIALIDVALRRRFGFIEVMPSYRVLLEKLKLAENVESEDNAVRLINGWELKGIDNRNPKPKDVKKLAVKALYVLNQKIQLIYDRDHQIGHSYLLKLKDGKVETLRHIWYYEVVPLLQEYFYNDWEKLIHLIGEFPNGFVEKVDLKDFMDNNLVYEEDAKVYRIEELDGGEFIKAMLSVAGISE